MRSYAPWCVKYANGTADHVDEPTTQIDAHCIYKQVGDGRDFRCSGYTSGYLNPQHLFASEGHQAEVFSEPGNPSILMFICLRFSSHNQPR